MSLPAVRWTAVAVLLGACTSSVNPAATTPTSSARARIRSIESFVVYYGAGRLDDLANYDLAIIDPNTLTPGEVRELESRGTLVVGYLSVGEINGNDPWLHDGTVPRSWILGRNRNWGSLFVNANQQGWRDLMTKATAKILDYGFQGVFLDTVDTAIDVAPETEPGMIELIRGLRTAYPDALLVQNRGFDIAERVAGDIDAEMFEDLSTSYSFKDAKYVRADNSSEADQLVALHGRTGLPILALDYADPSDTETAARAVKIARSYSFIPSVSVIQLDDIPDYGLTP